MRIMTTCESWVLANYYSAYLIHKGTTQGAVQMFPKMLQLFIGSKNADTMQMPVFKISKTEQNYESTDYTITMSHKVSH